MTLAAIEQAPTALARLDLVVSACDRLVAPDERRKDFLAAARLADRIYAAIKPHQRASEFALRMATITALAEKIREATTPAKADVSEVLRRIGEVLDRSIEGVVIAAHGPPAIDLSRIAFKALADKFQASPTKSLDLARFEAAIRAKLDRMIAENPTRADLREKFEQLIQAYNLGSSQIEQLFLDLLELTATLSDEETRHARENLSQEELVIFDLLTRPGPELSAEERDRVKEVARDLLARLRAMFTLDWQKTAQARARVQDAIEQVLDDELPPAYTPELFKAKAVVVFQHIHERYGLAA